MKLSQQLAKAYGGKKAAPFTRAGRKRSYPRTAQGTQRKHPR